MTDMRPEKACEIADDILEQTGQAMLRDDFDGFAQYFRLPHVIETPDRKTELKTPDALRSVFDRVVEYYRNYRVTELIRFTEVGRFNGPTRIEYQHVTHMMSGNQRVLDPFPSYSVAELIGKTWLVTSSQYAVDKHTTVGRALHLAEAEVLDPNGDLKRSGTPPIKKENLQ